MWVSRLPSVISSFGVCYPLSFAVFTATTKTAASDIFTQKYIENRKELDYRRLFCFTTFGCLFLGYFQYFCLVHTFAKWFPHAQRFGELPTLRARLQDRQGLKDLVKQTGAANFGFSPFLTFPTFYVFQEFIQVNAAVKESFIARVGQALERYSKNAYDDNKRAWAIWIPGLSICFALPLWLRMPVNNAMSFVFLCIVSATRGSVKQE